MEVFEFDTFLGNVEDFTKTLTSFIEQHGARTSFNELSENDMRKKIWTRLFDVLNDEEHKAAHTATLEALRILSRDKAELNDLISKERITILLKFADLEIETDSQIENFQSPSKIEALKLLCNLIYHSQQARTFLLETPCVAQIVQRLNKDRNSLTHEEKLFHLRLLFLITALSINTRSIVKNQLHGDTNLIDILADFSEQLEIKAGHVLKKSDINITCTILKVLFNLYVEAENEKTEIEKYTKLTTILYRFLITESVANEEELKSDTVNLLTVIPTYSYAILIPSLGPKDNESADQNIDIRALSTLLKFLDQRLNCESELTENISPILTVLIRLIKAERLARKYIRLQILPPLKDVMKRPEEGTTIRAKMCKQLTSPHTNLRDLIAELIFILCKENVGRMVKYTGYGNAAGMFANKGLLGGRQSKTNYSSESEDSDTDEYIKYKEQINPITGCYESPKPNPMEGMSEERKEYEALQLAQLMDKLTRDGIVQPCRIGEDGRPKPIEHVLELQSDSK